MKQIRILLTVMTVITIIGGHDFSRAEYREFDLGRFRAGADVSVDVEETVAEGLIAAGANVHISGKLNQGLTVIAANIDISGDVAGELIAAGANMELSGTFGSTVRAAAANVLLAGNFQQDVDVAAARLIVEPGVVGKGNLTYAAAILERRPGARILGNVVQKEKPLKSQPADRWRKTGDALAKGAGIVFWLVSTAPLFLTGWILHAVFPEQTEGVVTLISESPGSTIGVGLIALVVVPVAVVIAFFTVVGIPAAIIVGFIYAVLLYISRIYIGVWTGRRILGFFRKTGPEEFVWPLLLGIFLIAGVGLIPYVGWLFKLFCLLIGLGALCLRLYRSLPDMGKRKGDTPSPVR